MKDSERRAKRNSATPDTLEQPPPITYHPRMEKPHTDPPPEAWLETLKKSEADIAAGRTVPASFVHQWIHDAIARIEARKVLQLNPLISPPID